MKDEEIKDYLRAKNLNTYDENMLVNHIKSMEENKALKIQLREQRKKIRQDKLLVEKMKDLYFNSFNKKVLMSYFDDVDQEYKYGTMYVLNKAGKVQFNVEHALIKHLNGENILGLFANDTPEYTKYICFDVDTLDTDYLHSLIKILKTKFNINEENILVSYSGNKGYHVDLFFNRNALNYYPSISLVKMFYYRVIYRVQEDLLLDNKKITSPINKIIEFRPTAKQGCKLPLGKHFKTDNYCHLYQDSSLKETVNKEEAGTKLSTVVKLDVDVLSINDSLYLKENEIVNHLRNEYILSQREDKNYIPSLINQAEKKKESLIYNENLTEDEKIKESILLKESIFEELSGFELLEQEFIIVSNLTTPFIFTNIQEGNENEASLSSYAKEVLSQGKILTKGTRHEVMLELIRYFKMEDKKEEEYLPILKNIIKKSSDTMDTTVEEAIRKLEYLIPYVKTNTTFFSNLEKVKLSKQDLDTLLILKRNFKLKFTHISMLILLIRVYKSNPKDIIEVSYSLIDKHKENKANNKNNRKILLELDNLNLISFVNKDTKIKNFDSFGNIRTETNKFKINFDISITQNKYLVKGNSDFNKIVNEIYNKKIIIKVLDRKFKELFRDNGTYANNEFNYSLDIESVLIGDKEYRYI